MLPSLSALPVTPPSLQQATAELITQQTLAQLHASDIVRLLGGDKLKDILQYVGHHDPPMFLAALPKPKESPWIKDTCQWFYIAYGSSPIRLSWALYTEKPRSLCLHERPSQKCIAVAATAHEVNSALVPMLGRYNISEDAVADMILAAADYFSREAEPGDEKRMTHSNLLGRR